jgi:D-sedoheptulose 7-phosphate isomerase
MIKHSLENTIIESIDLHKKIFHISSDINKVIKKIYKTIKNGGKIYICGNGGSAADAQHLAAEFLIRLRPTFNRRALPVISLALDTSTITACGNDIGFDKIFARNLEALGSKKDVLIAISTSGNSKNILNVLKFAKKNKIYSVGFLGNKGGMAKKISNLNLIIPSSNTARIQEAHIFLGHYIFEQVENLLFKNNKI